MADVKDLDFESVDLGQFDYIEKSKSRDGTLNFESVDLGQFDVVDQKKTRLNATMSQAVIQNPTQAAKVRDLSRRSGIPAQAVESDIPSVETYLKLKNINLDDMVRTHPVTSDYLSQYDNAAVAHDDIDTLKNLESLMNPPATVQPEYLPFNTLRGLGGRITGLLGSLASGISQASDSIEENFPTGAFTIVGGIPMYIPPEQWSTLRKAGVGKDAVAAVGDELKSQDFGYIPRSTWDSTKEAFSNDGIFSGTAEALSFGVESGVVSLADMAATVYALPAYIFARSEEMGQARAKNKGMEKGTIRETLEAAPFAVGSAILERILPEKVLGGMSKTEVEKVGKAILEGATSKVKEVLNRATNGLIIEASTEAVQEGIIEYLGEKYGTDSNIVMAEMIDRALGGAVGGGIAGGAIAGGVETVNVNRSSVEAFFNEYAIRKLDAAQKEEMRLHLKGIQEQKSIDGINEYSANSELRKIDPDSFRQFIDQSDGDKDLSIFIDGVQAKLYVAQLPESNDPVVQMLNAKVSEAAALGSDVAIPIADFATMMAGTEHYDALREFMTLSGETTAPFRQEQRTTEFDNYVQSLMAEAEENTSSYVEAQDIYNSVREQLIDTGIVSGQNAAVMAQLVPAWATVFAQRNGITIKEAYEQSGLLIQGPQTGEAARLAADAEQLTQMENQQAIAKGLDMSQEARMQRAKDMGFDTDTVYYVSTLQDLAQFNPAGKFMGFTGTTGISVTDNPELASRYLDRFGEYGYVDGVPNQPFSKNVIPVYIKKGKVTERESPYVSHIPMGHPIPEGFVSPHVKEGFDTAVFDDAASRKGGVKHSSAKNAIRGKEWVLSDPSQIRSVNAAFDPEFKASPELLAQRDVAPEGFDNVDAQSFRDLATTALTNNPNGGAATIHTAEEYAGMDLYTTDEGRAGFAIENGMLLSVFKDPSSTLKGAMGTLVPAAIKAGANRLEAFDGFLTEQYAKYGFEEIDRIPWDDNFAPSGWDTATQGTPDVVVMKLKENDNARQQTTKTPENALQQSGGVRGSTGVLSQQNSRNAEREADGSLQGLPRQVGKFTASAWSPAQEVARKYAEKSGIPYNPPATYAEVDVNRARRIADAFEQGKHDPQSPEVKAAYQAMIDETLAQYESILESGLVVEFIDFATMGDPYDGSPRKMTEDVINNNHMYVFSTRDGFGSSELDVSDNPLLAETEFDISGQKALANDIFRVVHDYFGHVKEGVGFRASGEENAWRAHSAMYSPLARRAMTTETRGQNSWVNFGPNSEFNKTASGADTVYADQKVMLLPEWVSTEAAGDSEQFNQNQSVDQTETEEFKNWSDNGEVVESYDVNGYDFKSDTPVVLKVFHGTTHEFREFDASRGNKEGQFGAVNYFTSDEMDASENYAGMGPDLTNRVEQKAERLVDEIQDVIDDQGEDAAKEQFGEEYYDEDTMQFARNIARSELSGGDEIVMELFVKVTNPFVIGGESDQWIELRDPISDEEIYQQVADDTGEDLDTITENPEDFEDAINEARWAIEADRESPLSQAIDSIASRYDLDSSSILADLENIFSEETTTSTRLEELMRSSESLSYAEDPEDGGMISSHIIGEVIREMGYDSIILKDASKRFSNMTMSNGTAHVHIFDSNNTNIKSVDNTGAFDPANPDIYAQNQSVTRGYYSPSESIIRLNEAANLSTFLHEFAHFMYEMELTSAKQTPDSVNMISSIHNWYKRNADDVAKEAMTYVDMPITSDDVVAFLDSNTTGDEAKDKAIRRAVHEQFARGFETYLMEGKAPSIELRNAFRTFARWLTQVYRAVRGNLKVNLDPEMRKVFDTLLATEEQINAAEARANYAPMFTDAAMAGMTEQEFAEYKQKQDKVKDKQTETLRDKLIAEITRQSTKWWGEELEDEVNVQIETLKTERVYRAREALKEGEIKLDHAATKDLIGEDIVNSLGRKQRRVPPKLKDMTIKGAQGVHPDEAAALLGYGSGDEMLADLMDAPTIKERAEAQAEAVMLERHGDILHDGTIEKQADDALLNEERGALILTELKALGKGTKAPAIDRQMLKSMAEESIGKLAYRNIHPEKYRKAEIRAAQESAAALQAGNKEGAMSAKVRQAMNFYLHKAATEARNDTMKIVERMARYNTKTVKEAVLKAENGYWEQIVKILNRFEFRKSASLRGVDQRNQDINSWVKERVENDGDALILTPEVLDELFTTHWKNVEYDKLKGINDSVKNIEHVARYANKIKTMGEEIEFKKLVNRWTTHMDAATTTRFKSQRTDVAEGRSWGRMAMAQMTKIPFLASWLDGGERGGMSHDILVQPFTDAQADEVKLWTDVGQPVMELIEGRSKADIKRHNTKVFIRELVDENNDGNLYGNQIVAVALNTGNAGNLRKMLLGEGWANAEDESSISLDNPKLQAILRRMTKSDWDLVQTIWDRMELLYPQLSEVHRRTTGLVPPKVDATPVQTPYGEYKGGYYPVKYDPNRSQRAQDNEDKLNAQVDSMFSNSSSIQASVTASATNERTKYYAPIRLSLDVVPAHFQEAIHFITHHDAVRQANKLIRNPEVTKIIKEKLGPEEYAQLKPWLNDIAKDGREASTKLWWEDMIGRLRFGITLGSMGFKASTGIMQLLGVSNIAAEVGSKYAYQAFREILGSPANMKNAWDFASSNSKILKSRVDNMDREIKNAMSRINSQINIKSGSKVKDIFYRFDNSNVLKTVQEVSMKHIAYIQTYMVDLPTWYAAYIKELEASGDEAKAYRVADTTVEMIQGSGATKDLAAIMRTRNETTRMLTMFMTFFSSLWNMNRDLVKGAKSGQYSVTTVAAKLMFLTVVPVAAEMLLRGELDSDDEDEDTRLQKMLTKTALYPVASLPFVRDIASGTIGEFGYNMSPVASLVEQGTNSIPELIARPFTDEEITKGQIKGGSKFVAAALGIPATGQIWATGEHLYEVLEDGEELTARELLFGPKK